MLPRRPLRSASTRTPGEGSEDQEATQTKPQVPVKLLRQQENEALEAKNYIALGALFCIEPPMVKNIQAMLPPSKWIHIFGNVQTEKGDRQVRRAAAGD